MNTAAFYLAARLLVASVFIGLGASRLLAAAGLIAPTATALGTGALVFSAFELVAGLLIAVGWQLRWVASLMAAFLVVDAFLAHPFWRHDGAEFHAQLLHFLKNAAAIGGLLLLAWIDSTAQRSPS